MSTTVMYKCIELDVSNLFQSFVASFRTLFFFIIIQELFPLLVHIFVLHNQMVDIFVGTFVTFLKYKKFYCENVICSP